MTRKQQPGTLEIRGAKRVSDAHGRPRSQRRPRGGRGTPGRYSTRAEAAEALGIAPRVLDRWVERGAPGVRVGKPGSRRYDVEAMRRWQEERRDRAKPNLDLAEERARLARVQRLHTIIKIRQLRGSLIPREAVALLDAQRQGSVRAAILRLPSDAVQRGVPPECESQLRDLVEGVLSSLAAMTWEQTQAQGVGAEGGGEAGADG